jgi:hypothetical protein
MDFLALFRQVGFGDTELVGETGFDSSPVTKGAIFRGIKPMISVVTEKEKTMQDSLSSYQDFFDRVYKEGTIDRKTKHLIALGASLAAGCDG